MSGIRFDMTAETSRSSLRRARFVQNKAGVWQQVDSALCRLLILETDIGMNFARVATFADSTGESLHNRRLARRAYDTAEKWMARARLTSEEKKILSVRMKSLREALRGLGDPALQ
jgi:hypothetical protein